MINNQKTQVRIYLALGSNMGNRQQNLEQALDLLSEKMEILSVSPIYDTAPVGNTRQSRFLNLVCKAYTQLTPTELLATAKGIEVKLGREPGPVNSPRPIDIDILFYNDKVINTPDLIIPHPRIVERAFVLIPLADIAPDLVHPVTGEKIGQILKALKFNPADVIKRENR